MARKGRPVVGLIAEVFVPQADNLSRALGMPDWPRVTLPYPTGGIGRPATCELAREAAPAIVAGLEGR